ncbi:hypothetical protein [Streptomyces phaeochromogenes]|uniref:hypothetical protein n=1 Tax=Streptomyces phaeochromogenes TaxID=1923 RepID=UPI00386661F5|nr:hypothetical protein OHB08_14670 [Streptomyces phaeochromogenes]
MSELFVVRMPTLGASDSIFSADSSGTYQSAGGSVIWAIRRSGRSPAYRSTLNWG